MNDFTCDQFNELIFGYIDDDLNAEDKVKFENHLTTCAKCNEEFQKTTNLFSSIKNSRYAINNKLYASLLPQITVESKQMRSNNILKKIRIYGSAAVAAVIMIVILTYFMPMMNIVQDTTANDMQISETYSMAGSDEEAVAEENIPEVAKAQKYVAYDVAPSQAYALDTTDDTMSEYLNTYAPDYINKTSTLYITYDDVMLTSQIIPTEVIDNTDYSVYVIDIASNSAFNIEEVTNCDEVYNNAEANERYAIILSFNSIEIE